VRYLGTPGTIESFEGGRSCFDERRSIEPLDRAFPLRIPTRTAINEAREGSERKSEGLSSGNRRAAATPAETKLVESASSSSLYLYEVREILASSHVPRVTKYYVSYSSGEGNRRHGGS
jgi:hypothetical protein